MIDYGYGVVLRRLEEKDVDQTFSWRNSPEIMAFTRQYSPLHKSSHLKWFQKQSEDQTLSMFAVEADNPNYIEYAPRSEAPYPLFQMGVNKPPEPKRVAVGVVGLTEIDLINRRAEFSCYTGPEFQKKGYGKKALKTLFDYGFNVLGLNLIWGETFETNPARKVFQSLGMSQHGIRPQFYYRDGKYIDAILYGITRDKWSSSTDSSLDKSLQSVTFLQAGSYYREERKVPYGDPNF